MNGPSSGARPISDQRHRADYECPVSRVADLKSNENEWGIFVLSAERPSGFAQEPLKYIGHATSWSKLGLHPATASRSLPGLNMAGTRLRARFAIYRLLGRHWRYLSQPDSLQNSR